MRSVALAPLLCLAITAPTAAQSTYDNILYASYCIGVIDQEQAEARSDPALCARGATAKEREMCEGLMALVARDRESQRQRFVAYVRSATDAMEAAKPPALEAMQRGKLDARECRPADLSSHACVRALRCSKPDSLPY